MGKRSIPLGDAVRVMALHECQAIEDALAHDRVVDESIHEARKAMRRLRSVLALVEGSVEGLPAVGRTLQRLGDALSELRDAHVAVATARRLCPAGNATGWAGAIDALARREERLLHQAFTRDPGFVRLRASVRRIARKLQGLDWRPVTAKSMRAVVGRSQKRASKAEHRANSRWTADSLHRWRRRTRRLRMQLEALRSFAPDLARSVARPSLGRQLKELRDLGDVLGWRQDLQVLRARVGRMRKLPERALLLQRLRESMSTQ
jgi:CHAD domain-containing protein